MKVRYYLLYGLTILLVAMSFIFIRAANANIIDTLHSTDLLVEARTKTKPKTEAKSVYRKYAGVYFINKKFHFLSDANVDDISSNPIKEATCPNGAVWHQGLCVEICDISLYPYAEKPENKRGTVVSSKCVLNSKIVTRYMYTQCNIGWDMDNNKCEAHQCNSLDYPYTSNPGGVAGKLRDVCKSGDNYQYGYSSCYDGWDKDGSQCIIHICTGYRSEISSIAHCDSSESCQQGSDKLYRCKSNSCQIGYIVNSNGLCEAISCPTGQVNVYTHWCSDAWRCLMPGG